jgi:hypothetical protein
LSERDPGIGQWRKLYDELMKVKEIAPWEFMGEDEIFAVESPETRQTGFVSIMGAVGEHYAISVYLGERGLHGFRDFQHSPPNGYTYQKLLEIPQLQASFEDRPMLRPEDRRLIKEVGLKFRGSHSWPMFRSFRPGFFPWFFDDNEARFMQHVLEQTVNVCSRVKKDPSVLQPRSEDDFLLRRSVRGKGALVWQDSILSVEPPSPYRLEYSVSMKDIEHLKYKIPDTTALEMDLFMLTKPVQEKGLRPFFPYALMAMDTKSGMIIGNQLLEPLPTLEAMWARVASQAVELLVKIDVLPEKIMVSSELLYQLLSCVLEPLGVTLEMTDYLPHIHQARMSMMDYFST